MPIDFTPPQRMPWMTQASCADIGGDIWFPDGTHRQLLEAQQQAIDVCKACPVRQPCLDHALDLGPTLDGIWGATTPDDRRQLLRQADRKRRYQRAKARRTA